MVAVKITYPNSQCGMNFISELYRATTIEQQIEVLDHAFTHWGDGSGSSNEDKKSQVFFTDNVNNEKTVWPEIKKICHRGPVTHNRRYVIGPGGIRPIAVYILTWDDYAAWKEKREQESKRVKEEEEAKLAQELKESLIAGGVGEPKEVEELVGHILDDAWGDFDND